MKNQLKILIPSITFDLPSGGEVTLKPFKFKDFPQAIAIIERYFNIFTKEDLASESQIIKALFERTDDQYVLLEDICSLIALASNKSLSELNEFTYDEVLSIFAEVVEMNGDFFARIMQKIKGEKEERENLKTGELESAA
jgi:hypothetical protein